MKEWTLLEREDVDERVADVIIQTITQIRDTRPAGHVKLALWPSGTPQWVLVEKDPFRSLAVSMIHDDHGDPVIEMSGYQIDDPRLHDRKINLPKMTEVSEEMLPLHGLTDDQIQDSMLRVWKSVLAAA